MSSTEDNNEKRLINLLRGWPAPNLLPADHLKAAAEKVLSDPAIFVPALQYGPDPGYEPLREELARWLAEFYQVTPEPGRICITGGASQGLACVLQSFSDPAYTKAIWLIAPCYFLACPIFSDAGFYGRLKAVPEDDEGIDLAWLENGLKEAESSTRNAEGPVFKHPTPNRKVYRHVIYGVPTCANPSGRSMSLRRREGLVQLARKYDALVVCDDVYDFLQWPVPPKGEPAAPTAPVHGRLPRLVDLDLALGPAPNDPCHFGHAISNGSFSKIAGPGIRTGWVEASPAFAFGLAQTGSTKSGGSPSQLCSTLLWETMRSGRLEKHIQDKVRPGLQRRHGLILRALDRHLKPLGVTYERTNQPNSSIFGGYFIWLTLPTGLPADVVARRARETENLVVAQGELFEVRGDGDSVPLKYNIRLCFSWEDEDMIAEGVERLGRAVQHVLAENVHEAKATSRNVDIPPDSIC